MDIEALLMVMLVVAAVAVVIGIVLMIGGRGYPYSPQPYLFTKAEQVFLPVLERAAEPYGLRVYGKVRIADVLKVDLPDGSQRFWRWFRLISNFAREPSPNRAVRKAHAAKRCCDAD
jgi:hypothetical protein